MSEVVVLSDSDESVLSDENDTPKEVANGNKKANLFDDFDFPEVHFSHSSNVHQVIESRNDRNQRSSLNVDPEKLENEIENAFLTTGKNSKQRRISTSSDSTEDSEEEKKNRKVEKNVKTVPKKVKSQLAQEKLEQQKQVLRERALKKIAVKKSKNIEPGECMKFIEVVFDKSVENFSFLTDITRALIDGNIQYSIDTELIPNSITWKRSIEDGYVNESNEICTTTEIKKVDQTLIIWNWDEAVTKVAENNFCATISNMKALLPNNNLILVIYGIEDYFLCRKQTKNSVKNGTKNKAQKSNKSSTEFKNFRDISRQQFEMCLNEIQIIARCNSKLIENPQDLALIVYQCTKAVAETPYKLKINKNLMNKQEWYMMGDDKNTVRVDKDGNGLRRLWQQQLCQFNLSSLEIAEAICSIYPSPTDLAEVSNIY